MERALGDLLAGALFIVVSLYPYLEPSQKPEDYKVVRKRYKSISIRSGYKGRTHFYFHLFSGKKISLLWYGGHRANELKEKLPSSAFATFWLTKHGGAEAIRCGKVHLRIEDRIKHRNKLNFYYALIGGLLGLFVFARGVYTVMSEKRSSGVSLKEYQKINPDAVVLPQIPEEIPQRKFKFPWKQMIKNLVIIGALLALVMYALNQEKFSFQSNKPQKLQSIEKVPVKSPAKAKQISSKRPKIVYKDYNPKLDKVINFKLIYNPKKKPLTLEYVFYRICKSVQVPYLRKTTAAKIPHIAKFKEKFVIAKISAKKLLKKLCLARNIKYVATRIGIYFEYKNNQWKQGAVNLSHKKFKKFLSRHYQKGKKHPRLHFVLNEELNRYNQKNKAIYYQLKKQNLSKKQKAILVRKSKQNLYLIKRIQKNIEHLSDFSK